MRNFPPSLTNECFYLVDFDEINQWMYCSIMGNATLQSICNCLNQFLRILPGNHLPTIILDMRSIRFTFPYSQLHDWIDSVWTLELQKYGIRKIGVLLDAFEYGESYLIYRESKSDLKVFSDFSKLVNWLQQPDSLKQNTSRLV